MIVGIDIGGTNFRIGALDSNNNIVNFKKISVKDIFKSGDILEDIKNVISNHFKDIKIDGIGIGIPGTLDLERKIIVQVPNIIGMDNLPAKEYLEKEFNVPVYLERDVNMLINYDLFKKNIKQEGTIVAVYYGTGIGNAIMINGEIYIGKDGSAGELGHIPVDGQNEECGCGNLGCMEALAGGKYLVKLCNEEFKGTHISEVFTKHKDHELIKQFIDRMASSLATEINIINPHKIIIGGGIVNMKDFPQDLFLKQLKLHTRKPYPCNNLDIVFSDDDEKAGVIGSCLYVKRKLII